MSKKTIVVAAAGVLVLAGAAVAVSAPGHRGGWHDGPMMGDRMMDGDHMGGLGKRGWFGGSLTKEQYETRVRERFARFDKNGDNVIDPAEMESVINESMSRRFGGRGRGQMGQRLMRAFDANHDGKVTQDEFRAEVGRRFAEADINSDGKIDDADLPPTMRGRNAIAEGGFGMGSGHRRGMMRGLGFLRQADANKDGVVTKAEATAFADQQFARFDWNKDGSIDQADRDALRKEMVDYAVKRMAHRMGAGPDGKVTRDQFQAKAAERFARMDFNNDGTLSRDEMPGRRGGHGPRGWRHGGGHHGMGPHHDMGGAMPGDGGPRGPGRDGEPPAKN
ncbi:MAG: EF-hand domain-containing protein [Hyphomicrobiaceae bacterium]